MKTAEGFAGLAAGGPGAPRSALNVEIGRDRLVAWVRAELEAIKGARSAVEGSTVNDVILSVAAGALGRFLAGRGEEAPGVPGRPGPGQHPPPGRAEHDGQPDHLDPGPAAA